MKDVPYIAFESELARLERIVKKLFILLTVTVCLLVGTNAYWIWYESQWEEVTTTTTEQEITQDVDSGDGGDAIINDGVRINGESDSNSTNKNNNN